MATQVPGPAGMAEILQLFSGRRRSARFHCEKAIECKGRTGRYHGRTVNVSRLGALLEIKDPEFLPVGSEGSLMEVAERVSAEFPHGVQIRFTHVPVLIEARVLRVAQHPTWGRAVLGCEFSHPLTRRQCTALGLQPDRKGDAEVA